MRATSSPAAASSASTPILAGALIAVMLRCPHLDGTLDTLDDSDARKVAGVRDVIAYPGPEARRAVHGAARRRRRRARRQHLGRDQGPRAAQGHLEAGSVVEGIERRARREGKRAARPATKTASPCAATATWRRRRKQARYKRAGALRDAVPRARDDGDAGRADRSAAGQRAADRVAAESRAARRR